MRVDQWYIGFSKKNYPLFTCSEDGKCLRDDANGDSTQENCQKKCSTEDVAREYIQEAQTFKKTILDYFIEKKRKHYIDSRPIIEKQMHDHVQNILNQMFNHTMESIDEESESNTNQTIAYHAYRDDEYKEEFASFFDNDIVQYPMLYMSFVARVFSKRDPTGTLVDFEIENNERDNFNIRVSRKGNEAVDFSCFIGHNSVEIKVHDFFYTDAYSIADFKSEPDLYLNIPEFIGAGFLSKATDTLEISLSDAMSTVIPFYVKDLRLDLQVNSFFIWMARGYTYYENRGYTINTNVDTLINLARQKYKNVSLYKIAENLLDKKANIPKVLARYFTRNPNKNEEQDYYKITNNVPYNANDETDIADISDTVFSSDEITKALDEYYEHVFVPTSLISLNCSKNITLESLHKNIYLKTITITKT